MFTIRIKIWHKLFFSILLVVMLILALNMVISRLSFEQGFSQYIEEVRLKKLDSFRLTLGELYRQKEGWAFLKEDFQLWHQLLSEAELTPPPGRRGNPGFHRRGPSDEPGPPPPSPEHRGSPDLHRRGHPPEFGPPPPFMQDRIGLLDKALVPVIGKPSEEDRRLPIFLENEIVGYLSIKTFKSFRTEMDHQFVRKQLENLILTALLSFVIAIIAAILLARLFNKPIARLAEMARQLTSGKFDSRVQIDTQDELGDLAKDLNTLGETLSRNQLSRRQWIADISHELRTPLTILRGELEAMEDGVRPVNVNSIQSLSLESKQLQRLVDDLYQLSLSDQGSLNYAKEQLAPLKLLKSVTDGFVIPMQQKKITLTVTCDDDEILILADPQRLTQLFNNLLENSQRYTDQGGIVNVHCERRTGTSLKIYFEDSAPGVSLEFIPRLFERLFRLDNSRNRNSGGSGLGLSIAQSIAQAHGGNLTAEVSSLGGLKICLELPIEPEQ